MYYLQMLNLFNCLVLRIINYNLFKHAANSDLSKRVGKQNLVFNKEKLATSAKGLRPSPDPQIS